MVIALGMTMKHEPTKTDKKIRVLGFDQILNSARILSALLAVSLLGGCYAERIGQVTDPYALHPPPKYITDIFARHPDQIFRMDAVAPGSSYRFDPSEKDRHFASDHQELRFRKVEMSLCSRMPQGTVLVDVSFVDGKGTRITARSVNLMRLIPKLDLTGDMQYPEMLLEEYERFGVSFRREHDEFTIRLTDVTDHAAVDTARRAYRLGIWNNCLDPTKWEMVLTSQDYSDFDERLNGEFYINQNRVLAHSWFYLDYELYAALLWSKNPNLEIDPFLDYEELSKRAEQTVPNLDKLRKIKRRLMTETIEIGHQSRKKLVALDVEQHYKRQGGLVLNCADFTTYDDVLNQPVQLASFSDRGFYQPDQPKQFDFAWLRALDQVTIDTLDAPNSDCYVQITLTGKHSPYSVLVGNIDMALLAEQKLYGLPFGFNPYPKTRRHNPVQDTIHYETDRMPENIKPYVMLLDNGTGRWMNNQKKGLEKVYMGWDSIDHDVLVIYLVTYERIMPIWVAKVQMDDETVDRVRIRRRLYDY